jgi:hypothetical protein
LCPPIYLHRPTSINKFEKIKINKIKISKTSINRKKTKNTILKISLTKYAQMQINKEEARAGTIMGQEKIK